MKIYLPNNSPDDGRIGGGWTWARTFKKYAEREGAVIVDNAAIANAMLVAGPTVVEPAEVKAAHDRGLPIVFRVDNVPRKSRNRRNTPHERMRFIAGLATVVVYQSEWAARYCQPLCGPGTVIYNGADTDIFYPAKTKPSVERWLWAYHSRGNELKGFWEAHLRFQLRARENPRAEFVFVADFGRETEALRDANFDFWNGERYEHIQAPIAEPEEMANLMRGCTHLVYPSISDAGPNIAIEAVNCGLELVGAPDWALSSVAEIDSFAKRNFDFSAERMAAEYLAVCGLAGDNSEV